jgi:tetratricopeptide (TPR) repeat protein
VLEQLCLAAIDLQDHVLAETCLTKLRDFVSKDSFRFRRLVARCLESAGETLDAQRVYDKLLEENPGNLVALKRKYCLLQTQTGKEVEAMEALNAYLEQNMSDTAAWYELANRRLELGDYQGAAYALEEVILASPLESPLHCKLAEVYATNGGLENLKLARKHMSQSLELDPSNRRAQLGLVFVANAYVEESAKASKKEQDEHEVEVAKALVSYGAEQVQASYKGTKLAAAVTSVTNSFTKDEI